MPLLTRLASLWRNWFAQGETEQHLNDERARMNPEEALRAAHLELRGMEQVREGVRQ